MNLSVQPLTDPAAVAALEPLAHELVEAALAEERDEGAPAGAGHRRSHGIRRARAPRADARVHVLRERASFRGVELERLLLSGSVDFKKNVVVFVAAALLRRRVGGVVSGFFAALTFLGARVFVAAQPR